MSSLVLRSCIFRNSHERAVIACHKQPSLLRKRFWLTGWNVNFQTTVVELNARPKGETRAHDASYSNIREIPALSAVLQLPKWLSRRSEERRIVCLESHCKYITVSLYNT